MTNTTPYTASARKYAVSPFVRGSLLMIASAAAWGMGTVMSKYSLDLLPPMPLLAVQLTASIAVLWLLTLWRYPRAIRSWQDIRVGWTGMLEPGLAYALSITGLVMTSASSASLIFATEPIFIILISVVFLREKVRPLVWLTVAVVVLGAALVSSDDAGGGAQNLLGDMLLVLATASAALYVIFSRRSVETRAPMPVAAVQQSFGLLLVLVLLPFFAASYSGFDFGAVTIGTWTWAMLTGVVQYALAFFLYLTALRDLRASQAALYLTLIPVFGVAGAALFLGEAMTGIQLLGAGMIIGALVLLNVVQKAM
jgi:drug/metabolite transporter (DMT)-like permease